LPHAVLTPLAALFSNPAGAAKATRTVSPSRHARKRVASVPGTGDKFLDKKLSINKISIEGPSCEQD